MVLPMRKVSINLFPATERYFNYLIGELRKNGIIISLSEFVNYTAWMLQKHVPNNEIDYNVSMTKQEVEEERTKIEQFRKEMKEVKE